MGNCTQSSTTASKAVDAPNYFNKSFFRSDQMDQTSPSRLVQSWDSALPLSSTSRRTVMQTALKLPPSGRDFQVYQRVIVDGITTREAAREFSLSQTRVRQVVQRVSDWLTTELPAASKETDQVQLWLAKNVAADRLQGLYGETMSGWRTHHDTKNFGMALRVIMAQSKMPALPGKLEALAADAVEGPLPLDEAPQLIVPPTEDCSESAASEAAVTKEPSQTPDATPCEEMTCDAVTEEVCVTRRAFFGPAQLPAATESQHAVGQLEIT